nr:MAG TPA: hypothetical protein [Caudoviricetes sp.]
MLTPQPPPKGGFLLPQIYRPNDGFLSLHKLL